MLELYPRPPELNFWAGHGRTEGINSEKGEELGEARPGILYLIKLPSNADKNSLTQLSGAIFENHCHGAGWHHWANVFLSVNVACRPNGL